MKSRVQGSRQEIRIACMMELASGMLGAVGSFRKIDVIGAELFRVRRTSSKSFAFPAE